MTGRRTIPMQAQRDAALYQLGLDPNAVRLDHSPALSVRERTPDGGYIPDECDPRYLQWLRLSMDQVHEIRRLYKDTRLRQKDIGGMFGVSQRTVCLVVAGKSYK